MQEQELKKHDPLDDLFIKKGEPLPKRQYYKKSVIPNEKCFRCNKVATMQCWVYWSIKQGKHTLANWCSEACLKIVEANPNINYKDSRHRHREITKVCAGEKDN